MGSFNMEATQINYRRDETIKTVDQKLQELSQESAIDTDIAPVFKSTSSYAVGDLVYYRNKLYTCTTPHSGAWAAADFTATDVTTAIKSAAAVKADEADIASSFDATVSYAVGDLVYYGGKIYRCTNAHEGDWDADDFSATTISGEINSLMSGLNGLIGGTFSIMRVVPTQQITQINYPSGHNKDNTVILTVGYKASDTYNDIFWASVMSASSSRYCYTDNGGIRLVVDESDHYNRPHYIVVMKMTLPTE